MKITPFVCTAALLSAFAGSALAGEGHVDGLLLINPDGKLVTGGYDFENATVESVNTRVYEGEFDAFGSSDEPGFNAVSNTNTSLPAGYTTLPGSTAVSFNANAFSIGASTANLWHWDGIGAVNFAPVSSPTQLQIVESAFSSILNGSASDVAGFVIDTTSASGFLHKHITFNLSNTDASTPDGGFYLWSLTLSVGQLSSDPAYFVHGFGEHNEIAHEAAVDFIQSTVVPEPSSLALLSLGGLALMRRRR